MLLFNEDASVGPEPMLFNARVAGGFVRNPGSQDDPAVGTNAACLTTGVCMQSIMLWMVTAKPAGFEMGCRWMACV